MRIRGTLAALAVSALTLLTFGATAAQASTVSSHGWMTYQAAEHAAYGLNAAQTKWAFNSPAPSEVTCSNPGSGCINDAITAQNSIRYASETAFASDVAAHRINLSVYKYAVYDIEDGNGTPPAESQQAPTYMANFNKLAAANGLIPVITPARDNGNDANWCPKKSGENLDNWSVRCNLWGKAAAGMPPGGVVVIQTQADTTSLSAFDSLEQRGASEITAANSNAQVWDEISCNYGTDAQRVAALESEPSVKGSYFSFSTAMASHAITDWGQLQAAGW